jgi:hypothetical protein
MAKMGRFLTLFRKKTDQQLEEMTVLPVEFEGRFKVVLTCSVTSERYPSMLLWLDANSKAGIQIQPLDKSRFCVAFEDPDDATFFKIKFL